jgi:integrase
MPSIKTDKNSPFWIACIRRNDGTRTNRSTKLENVSSNRRKALELAHAWEAAYREIRTREQSLRVVRKIADDILGASSEAKTIREVATNWLERKEQKSVNTHRKYRSRTNHFLGWIEGRKGESVNPIDVSRVDILDYQTFLVTEGRANVTVNDAIQIIGRLFGYCITAGCSDTNPAKIATEERLSIDRDQDAERDQFCRAEIEDLYRAAEDSPDWAGMIRLGLYTAQRLSDLAFLDWSQIDLERRILSLRTKKTRRKMRIPLAAPLFEWLEGHHAATGGTGPLFESLQRFKDNDTTSGASAQFKKLALSVGVSKTFHCLRHTTPSWLAARGVPMQTVMKITGHSSAAMAEHYTHTDDDEILRALSKLD